MNNASTNNINNTDTNTAINTNSCSTYYYTTEKSCDTCIHEGVCKYESECRKAMKHAKKLLSPVELGNKLWLSINTSCNYYRAEGYSITYANNGTAIPRFDITC